MLFDLVERVCQTIDDLDVEPDPELAEQIRAAAPDAIDRLVSVSTSANEPVTPQKASRALALVAHTAIKSIPPSARAMVAQINEPRIASTQRCAMASILAYLVQPHDLIPDNAPGNYGYVDDAALLQAGVVEYLDTFPAGTSAETSAELAACLVMLSPPDVRQAIQRGISSMSQAVQILAVTGPEVAEGALERVVQNPLRRPAHLTAPPGFAGHPARDYSGTFFGRTGAYIDGDNFLMGGGGAWLISGTLFIPR